MSLIPALERELLQAAVRTQPSPGAASASTPAPSPGLAGAARTGRRIAASRRLRAAPLAVIAAASLVVAGGAYAARGLWLPELGNDAVGHAVATASAVPKRETDLLGVLRRPQTDADRGPAARAVLRQLSAGYGEIRTGAVRQVGTLPDGRVAVVVPIRTPHGFDPTLPDMPRDQVFLGFYDPTAREAIGPEVPSDARGLLDGDVMLELKPRLTDRQRELQAAFYRREAAAGRIEIVSHHPLEYGITQPAETERLDRALGRTPSSPATLAGLVPDGVTSVRVGSGTPVAVHDNFYAVPTTIGSRLDPTWLDAHGHVVPLVSTAGAWK